MFHHHSRVESKTKAIIIEDVPFHTFQELIHYSYKGLLSVGTHDVGEIQMIFVAASKYLMNDITKYCLAYFEKNINNNNVIWHFSQITTPSIKIKTDPTIFLSTLEQMLHVHSAYQWNSRSEAEAWINQDRNFKGDRNCQITNQRAIISLCPSFSLGVIWL